MQHVGPKANSRRPRHGGDRHRLCKPALGGASIKPDEASALLVIDVQNCFLPGGSLAVKDGDQVVPVINRIAKGFANVVLTQDWHTAGPCLVRNQPRRQEAVRDRRSQIRQAGAVARSLRAGHRGRGASKELAIPQAALIIRKGFNKEVDSYSAFTEADGKTTTGLAAYLKARKIEAPVPGRTRHRFLRRVERAGRAQGRLRNLCGRRRLPRHRHPGLAGKGLGGHDQGRRQAHSIGRYRGLTKAFSS